MRFRLVASSIAGRALDVAPVDAGDPPWTDGATIFVDERADGLAQLQAISVQAALVSAGSLDPGLMHALAGRPALCRRYLAVEGHRALSVHTALLPIAARGLVDAAVAARVDSPEASLRLARSKLALPDPPGIFGEIRPRRVRPTEHPAPAREQPVSEPHDMGASDLDLTSPVGGGGPISRLLKRMFLADARSTGAGAPGVNAAAHLARSDARRGEGARVVASPATVERLVVPPPGVRYPEWDTYRRRYRSNWCTVTEVEPGHGSSPAALPDHRRLVRPIARLGLDLERAHRQMEGDDIDVDAAVEAVVDATTGSAPEPAVYISGVRRKRDLSVLVLLDVSGSAREPGASGTVHDLQRSAAGMLAVALHQLGDRVAVFGFRSQGRTAVHVLPVTRFGEPIDGQAFRRLHALTPGGYTRLGAAIRHGGSVLREHGGTTRRLLVVVSDGFAYDHGYEGAYAEADARRALAELRRRGVGCLCLTVGATIDADGLARVFGTAAHARIRGVDELAAVVGPLFRSALQSAELHRTLSLRTERWRERQTIERQRA